MSSGKPLIAYVPSASDTWKTIESARAGICVESGDKESFINAILRLENQPKFGNELGRNGREWVLKNCDSKYAVLKYINLFEKIKTFN
jgi:glycosyltransferase involved in cell wall biosynthesis